MLGLCRSAVGARVDLDGGHDEVSGLFVSPSFAQAAPFGRTSLLGVSAAGDMAQHAVYPMPLASVLSAASSGLVAASALDQELMTLEAGFPSLV